MSEIPETLIGNFRILQSDTKVNLSFFARGHFDAPKRQRGASLAGDEVLAGAILDRLLHSATVLNIQGRSYRLRDLDAQLQEHTSTTTAGSPEPATNLEQPSAAMHYSAGDKEAS